MNTSAPYLLRRVVARAGLGVWRHRTGVLLAAIATAGIATYVIANASSGAPMISSLGPSAAATSDCADTAIAVIADKSAGVAQRAYQCMDPGFQQRVPEQVFVQQMQAQSVPNVQKLARVGDYQTSAGGSIVYYAVDANNGQSVGYIVYLSPNGKVLRIE